MNKQAEADNVIAGTGDKFSYWNTLNPLSFVIGGNDRYPEFVADMFPDNKNIGYLAFKSGACMLLAAAAVGGFRALKHFDRMNDMAEKDHPGGNLSSQISTSFEGNLGPSGTLEKSSAVKKAAEGSNGNNITVDPLDWTNIIGTAVPVGATLLAASLAYKGVDSLVSARRNRLLDQTIARKDDAIKGLIQTRARIAKGTATDKEVNDALARANDEDIYMKTASQNKEALLSGAVSGAGLLVAALMGASAIGSYTYFKANDPNNIKFKAYQKGLKEYARSKAGITPISVTPTDSKKYFAEIDKDAPKATMRTAPEVTDTDLNKPISVTI